MAGSCACVCVFGGAVGLEQDLDKLTVVENERSCIRAMETLSELALDGNTGGHSNKDRFTFLLRGISPTLYTPAMAFGARP